MDILESIITVIMDCLEECFETMTLATGKRLVQVFYVCLGLLGFAVVARLLKLPVFITWQEALTASTIMGAIMLLDIDNRISIKNIKTKFMKGDKEDGE